MKFTLDYADNAELIGKLKIIAHRFGYRMERAFTERITVGELARRTGRNLSNVSTRIRSKHCPPFVFGVGRRKILWLEPNDQLISFLTNSTPGQRNDR